MQRPKENCPDCNTPQSFPLRTRPHKNGSIEIYIACTVCTFEQVLRVSTHAIEAMRRRLARYEAKRHQEERTFGSVQRHTQDTIRALVQAIAIREGELDG